MSLIPYYDSSEFIGLGFGLAVFDTRLIKQSLEGFIYSKLVSLLVLDSGF